MPHDSADVVVFTFGKYTGYTIGHVLRNDSGYLQWIKNNKSFDPMWREAVILALEGNDISHLKQLPRKEINKPTSFAMDRTVIRITKKNATTAKIQMPYDKSLIARFKMEIDGRKWNGKDKQWEFPIAQLPRVVSIMNAYDVKVTPEIKRLHEEIVADNTLRHQIREKEDTDFVIPDLRLPLFPYQRTGVEFLYQTKGRALIADQPGLGKSCQAIAYAKMLKLKTLVVAPLSVVINWKKEVKKFTGETATVWTTKEVDGDLDSSFHITNYDAVRKIHDVLRDQGFDLLVCDEATFLKNRNTLRHKSLLGSWKERKKYPGIKTKHVIFLTGTPVMSRPIEAFTLMNTIDSQRFNNFYHFTQRYGGWKGVPVKNLTELHERTKDLTIRRKKSDVLGELPDKQRNDLYISLSKTERAEYEELLDELFKEWTFNGKPTIGTMPKIQGFLIDKKIPRLREIIEEYQDNDRPLLIFCCYIDPLKKLKEELGDDASLFHGSMTKEERQNSIDDLASGRTSIGLFSLKAAGFGIDGLQHVIDTSIFLDFDWTPANHEQAEDRIHRIGQDKKVQIYYMRVDDTIDDYMADLTMTKLKIASEIVDGEVIDGNREGSIFGEFIKMIKWETHKK